MNQRDRIPTFIHHHNLLVSGCDGEEEAAGRRMLCLQNLARHASATSRMAIIFRRPKVCARPN